MEYEARILHNIGPGRFFAYRDTDDLVEADQLHLVAENDEAALNLAYHLCNIDGPHMLTASQRNYAPAVQRYRDRGNRSLSVADVVTLTPLEVDNSSTPVAITARSRAWAVATIGFEPLDGTPTFAPDDPAATTSASYLAHTAAR